MEKKYIQSAGVILLFTGMCKFISACGGAPILQFWDPLFNISFRHLLWFVGGGECVVGLFCFVGGRTMIQAAIVAWLSTAFLIYRLALIWIGYHRPCMCMGNLTDALHIPAQTADNALKLVLAYLLLGSWATLVHLLRWRILHFVGLRLSVL